MAKELNFRIILSKVNEKSKEDREAIAMVLASIFELPFEEIKQVFTQLPVILFDDISSEDLKKIRDRLVFLSKLGLDFSITFKPFPKLYRTGWKIKSSVPMITCPNCGEEFVILHAHKLPEYLAQQKQESKPIPLYLARDKQEPVPKKEPPEKKVPAVAVSPSAQPAPEEDANGFGVELEEVEVLSKELEAIVQRESEMGGDEYIEEVGSISDEIRQVNKVPSDLETIGSISAEFEEIEGVSAEFEKVSMESMNENVGSLAPELPELKEVETGTSEQEQLDSELGIELPEKSDILKESTSSPPGKPVNKDPHEDSDYELEELEELEELSADLEKIAEQAEGSPGSSKDGKPVSSSVSPGQRNAKAPKDPVKPMTGPLNFPHGEYDVAINFSGRGNIKVGTQLLARIKGVRQSALTGLEQKNEVVVAKNVAKDTAEKILSEFQKLKMQGKIVPTKKK